MTLNRNREEKVKQSLACRHDLTCTKYEVCILYLSELTNAATPIISQTSAYLSAYLSLGIVESRKNIALQHGAVALGDMGGGGGDGLCVGW